MKRRLVKQGAATMMISLPTKWIKENKLDKGDEIELEEVENKIVITRENRNANKQIEIALTKDNKEHIRNLLTHSYRKGYDKIILTGEVANLANELQKITSNVLLGFEVVERNNEKIVLENISQPEPDKYGVMLSKIFLLIEDMPQFAFSKEKINLSELENTRDLCDKFVLFCRRIISEKNIENSIYEWEFLTFLTHIQHNYYYMFKYVEKQKLKIDPTLNKLIAESKDYFSILKEAYVSKDLEKVYLLNKEKTKYQFGKCIDSIEKLKGKQAVVASYLREIFRLIQIGSSPLLAEILEKKD